MIVTTLTAFATAASIVAASRAQASLADAKASVERASIASLRALPDGASSRSTML